MTLDDRSEPIPAALQVPTQYSRTTDLATIAASSPILAGFAHVSEREPGPWICCAPCSGAMVAHYVAGAPATLDSAHKIRTAAGLGHTGGMSPASLELGMQRAYGLAPRRIARTAAAITAELEGGAAIVLPHWYGQLPDTLRRWSPRFTGGHSATIAGLAGNGRWGWWDPLAPRGWTGEWVDPGDIMPAAWSGGILATNRGADMAITLPQAVADSLATLYRCATPGPTTFYNDALCTDPLFDSDAGHSYPYLGFAGVGPADARAVVVQTGRPYADKEPRPTVLYVPKDKIGDPLALEQPSAPGAAELALAKRAGRLEEYERWRDALSIPEVP